MKILKLIFFLAILILAGLLGCKKNNNPAPKDYTASVKDKTWWGVFTYTGQTAEYYSVHFNADNTLLWSQLSGDYVGTWSINNKSLTLKFSGSSAEIKTDISDDDKFISISDNTASYEINNGQQITSPNITLENTIWKGSIVNGTSGNMQLKFLLGVKVELTLITTYTPFIYSRVPSGGAFRFDTGGGYFYFGVITSATTIKGSGNASQFPFQLTKQ
jgi:hypothetical protein